MRLDPKTLIPDVKDTLAKLDRALAVLPACPLGPRAQLRVHLLTARQTVTFLGAALGDPELTAQVMAWPVTALGRRALDSALTPAPIVPGGAVRGPDGVLRFADDPTAVAQFAGALAALPLTDWPAKARCTVCDAVPAAHAVKEHAFQPNYNLPPWHLSARVPDCPCDGCRRVALQVRDDGGAELRRVLAGAHISFHRGPGSGEGQS